MEINKMSEEQNLNERVAILEAKVDYLSKIFLQIGETIALEPLPEAVVASEKKVQQLEKGECHEQPGAVSEPVKPSAFDSILEDYRHLDNVRLANEEQEKTAAESRFVNIIAGVKRGTAEEQDAHTVSADLNAASEVNVAVVENDASEANVAVAENDASEVNVAVAENATVEVISPIEVNTAVVENSADEDMQLMLKAFMAAYDSVVYDNDDDLLPLEVEKAVLKKLNNYLEWQQVPDNVREELKLVDAYESTKYYAKCEQIKNEFIYMVTPVQPDTKYSPKELKNLGLPFFFEIEYARETGGQLLELLEPAIFKSVGATYVLYKKGKLRLAR